MDEKDYLTIFAENEKKEFEERRARILADIVYHERQAKATLELCVELRSKLANTTIETIKKDFARSPFNLD